MSSDPAEMYAVLDRRERILRATPTRSVVTKAGLVAAVDVSESTVDRALRQLVRVDLVTSTPDGYQRTLTGSLALTAYDAYRARVDGLAHSRGMLSMLPDDAPVSLAVLDGAKVVTSTPEERDRAHERLTDLFDRAERVWGFGPLVDPNAVRDLGELLVEQELPVKILFTASFVERLFSRYGDSLREVVNTGHFELRQTDELPFSLIIGQIGDGYQTALIVPAEAGAQAMLLNDTDAAAAWALETFEERWSDADRLTESVFS